MRKVLRLPACRACGRVLTAEVTNAPRPGEMTMCAGCGELSVLTHRMTLRAPSRPERRNFCRSDIWTRMMKKTRKVKMRVAEWKELLKKDRELRRRVNRWLEDNPPPPEWEEDGDAYAYLEMPVGWSLL